MIGQLLYALRVNDIEYQIDADFRNVLTIIEAMNDATLNAKEKMYICVRRLYTEMPADIADAYKAAAEFIDAGHSNDDKPRPQLVDWSKDESIIFPAINKVAGTEVRAATFLHWHTFLGYFMETGDGVWNTVLTVRQKRAKGKPLEKWEREFYNANRDICSLSRQSGGGKKSLANAFAELVEKE